MNFNRFITGLLAFSLLFAANNCSTNQNSGTIKAAPVSFNNQVSQFYPLVVGNKWSYSGSLAGITTDKTVEITANADGYYLDNSGGALQIDRYGLRDKEGRYLLRGPLTKGTSWTSVPAVASIEHYEIIGEGKSVTTPAGTFNGCLVVKSTTKLSTGDTINNLTTFAPKTGIVRLQTFIISKGQTVPQSDLLLTAFSGN